MAHGGDRYRNNIQLDFSVNLNPLDTPECLITAMQKGIREVGYYPDPEQEAAKKAAAGFYSEMSGVKIDPSWAVPGNGASELISAVVHAVCLHEVLIPAPCFTGYLHACHSERKEGSIDSPAGGDGVPLSFVGNDLPGNSLSEESIPKKQVSQKALSGRVVFYRTKEEKGFTPDDELGMMIGPKTELLILTNPGNPAGGLIDSAILRRILQITRERKIPVLLDECFMEFTGRTAAGRTTGMNAKTTAETIAGTTVGTAEKTTAITNEIEESGLALLSEFPNLMVLRAFTKIFSMPGLRLGILFTADRGLQRKISAALPEWNLSCFAEAVLGAAAEEKKALWEYIRNTVKETKRLRGRMEKKLSELGTMVYPSDANFLLTKGLSEYREKLLSEGILVRSCGDMWPLTDDYIRLSVRPEPDQDVLFKALKKIMAEKERTTLWINRLN